MCKQTVTGVYCQVDMKPSTHTTREQNYMFLNESEPLTHISTTLAEIVSKGQQLTWMVQPEETAIYVHIYEEDLFDDVLTYLSIVTQEINTGLEQSFIVGKYYCSADKRRHCIDVYYQRY